MSDLAIDLLDRTPAPTSARIASWIRVAEVTFVAVVLISLSFVLGRVSNNHSGAVHVQTGQTAPAGLSPQTERQAQARLLQANGIAVSNAGPDLPTRCVPLVPC